MELLVVLAIIGLVLTLSPPMLQPILSGERNKVSVFRFADAIQAAHQKSMNDEVIIQIALPNGQTEIFYPDGSATAATIRLGTSSLSITSLSGRPKIE